MLEWVALGLGLCVLIVAQGLTQRSVLSVDFRRFE